MTDFHGTDASEVLIGTSGDDVFYSSKGQDILDGAAGWDKAIIDYSLGGAGQSRAHNVFYLYDGLYGAFTGDVYPGTETVRIEELDVKTSEASDVFYLDFTQIATPWKVSIDAGGGTGFDVVSLRLSSQVLVGTVVNGSLTSGNLSLTGFEQFDLYLAGGNDNLTLGAGSDTVEAGGGNDFIDGGTGNDRLEGGLGGDTLRGGEGDDLLFADDDYLMVDLGSEIDNLNGGAGNDLVSIGYGDSADGGEGVDRLSLSLLGGTAGVVLDLGAMFAGGTATFGGGTIKGFETYSIIYGTNYADTINTGNAASSGGFGSPGIYGYDGDDRITTGNQADTAGGGAGNDIVRAGAGNDRASGDDGNDQVFGEAGDDSLWGGEGDDIVFGGDGIDTILGGGGVDRLVGEGGDDILDGEGGDDQLEGGIGNDQLTGGFGNDSLQGGAGDDFYKVDAGDTVVEAAGAGSDTILTEDASYSLAALANVENLTGWYSDQVLTGNAADNRIDGSLGADTMTGGAGNDIYFVDNEGDRTVETAGGGTDEVRSSISWALEDHVENLLLTGFSDIDGVGNDLANTVVGNSGSNILLGEGGDDRIFGGEGIDILMGGLGADLLDGGADPNGYVYLEMEESAGASVDTIKGFKTGLDLIDVSGALGFSVSSTFAEGVSTVTVETVYGPMTIKIEGVVAQDDFILAEGLITGTAGDDTLQGTDEADIIFGGSGADTMTGGAGDDYYFVGNFGDTVVEAADGGVDGVESTFPTYTLEANVEYLILRGNIATEGIGNDLDNLIFGSNAGNTLSGRGGDDLLDGGLGADQLLGGLGNDIYVVDHGGDVVTEDVGAGTDEVLTDLAAYTLAANVEYLTGASATGQALTGNALANFLTGGDGNDRLDGGLGADQLEGGLGDDVYIVAAGDSVIEAAFAGTDEVRTSLAAYTLGANLEKLTGTSAAGQTLNGNDLANMLTGGAGNDILDGGLGDDTMAGGLGNDLYRVDAPGDAIVETGGTDEVRTAMFDYSLADGVENLTGTAFFSQILRGNALGNLISGGEAGDSMLGGDGNDVYLVGAGDFVQEFFGQGDDEIRTSLANYSLNGNVERLTGTSATGQYLTGNELANTISGGAGNDQIDGGLGADQLSGGGGNDLYTVDSAADVVIEAANAGIDEVRTDLAAYTLTANVEKLSGFAFLGQSLTGNALANTVTGGGGADRLDGGAGADVLRGGAGDDVYVVDNGGDQLIELTSDGIDTVESALSFTLAADFENLTLTGAAAINGTGNALANTLTGNAGANILNGGGGDDTMAGGLGNDVYIVDAGDVVTEAASAGTDEVRTSLAAYALSANVERLVGTSGAGQTLTGNALANILTGSGGNDLLDGSTGGDQMAGGLGNDVYFVDAGDVVTEAPNAGTDEIRTTLADSTLSANVENFTGLLNTGQTLRGNALGNFISGGTGADRFVGGLGNDIYLVGAGDIVIESSGAGTDEVRTALAAYTLTAEVERLTGTSATGQILTGNALANVIAGGVGNDSLNGGLGGDQMAGGLGNDVYFVDAGDSVVEAANAGTDEIRTTVSDSTLSANVENFTGLLNTGQTLRGNALGNFISGGTGADRMVGGLGDDTYLVRAGDNVIESAGAGTDEVRTALAAYTLTAEVERLTGTSATGQALTGNALANVLTGGAGNDVLNGGLGGDQMAGGLGNDVYVVDGDDVVTEAANAGIDEIRTTIADSTAGANIENLTGLLGSGQTLRGNALNNLIAGGAGADLMIGGLGNDIYVVAAGDTVSESAGEGTDEIRTALSAYTLAAEVERLTGISATGQTLTGNGLANAIFGGAGNDVLNGGLGADQMAGGLGNDVYFVDSGDSVAEAANAGIDEIRTTIADLTAGANIENLTGLLDTGQTLRGNALGNLISGGTGADRMVGGLGDDVYIVGAGDNVIEKVGEGVDEVRTALASYTLTAEVEQLTGTSAAQTLTGNALANLLAGGAGGDTLTGGGGADVFRYQAVTDSYSVARDHIVDFTPGTDKIDLSAIDASRALAGNQAFTWIGSSAFSNAAGELRAFHSGSQWIVEGDIDGNGSADLVIALTLQGPAPLGAGDFVF
jgi:serralysin